MRSVDQPVSAATPTVLRAVAVPEPVGQPDEATMEAHLARSRYGRFSLTDAIRPGWQLDVVPQAGYRYDSYVDPHEGTRLPALVAAVSSEDLFETFLELLEPLGDTCDVVLEASHEAEVGTVESAREGIERVMLESTLWDFEDVLLHDGCAGIAVMNQDLSMEVQLDEHKLLIVYAPNRLPFERILRARGLLRDDRLRFISQGEHMHTSSTRLARRCEELATHLGTG